MVLKTMFIYKFCTCEYGHLQTKTLCPLILCIFSQVFSQTKKHALYLWIHLKPTADVKACARVCANLQKHVDAVCPPNMRDEDDEIWAGVGFGPNFFAQVHISRSFVVKNARLYQNSTF